MVSKAGTSVGKGVAIGGDRPTASHGIAVVPMAHLAGDEEHEVARVGVNGEGRHSSHLSKDDVSKDDGASRTGGCDRVREGVGEGSPTALLFAVHACFTGKVSGCPCAVLGTTQGERLT